MRLLHSFCLCLMLCFCAFHGSHAQQVYNPAIWTELVDKTWGEGRPTSEKLALFDSVWNIANRSFPYFATKPPINWDSLRTRFRPDIEKGVSQGKFMAYMSRLVYHLNDVHISFSDRLYFLGNDVLSRIYVSRVPVFFVSPTETLGMCITTLPDGRAMVYEADTANPLKLKPGDIIVGYNGRLWRDYLSTLLNSDLPIIGSAGSTSEHQRNILLAAVLSNWHLFDNIQILRVGEKTPITLPTSLMVGWYGRQTFCRDGLPVAGVPRMTWSSFYTQRNEAIWGKITGTNIGYIYAHRCTDSLGKQFYNAVKELTQDNPSDALILDLRRNDGGGIFAFSPGWSQLYNQPVRWLSVAFRDTAKLYDRSAMIRIPEAEPSYEQSLTSAPERFFTWYRYQPKLYDKPIAVLAGPSSVSAGDLFVHAMRYHPRVRIFGKPSNGAFGSRLPWRISRDSVNISFTMPNVNFYDVRTGNWLGGRNYPIDDEVWLSQKNVIAGNDDVVEAAMRWIGTQSTKAVPSVISSRVYPNPFVEELSVRFNVTRESENVQIRLATVLSQSLTSFEEILPKGEHTIALRAPGLARGVYIVTIITRDKREVHRVVKN